MVVVYALETDLAEYIKMEAERSTSRGGICSVMLACAWYRYVVGRDGPNSAFRMGRSLLSLWLR